MLSTRHVLASQSYTSSDFDWPPDENVVSLLVIVKCWFVVILQEWIAFFPSHFFFQQVFHFTLKFIHLKNYTSSYYEAVTSSWAKWIISGSSLIWSGRDEFGFRFQPHTGFYLDIALTAYAHPYEESIHLLSMYLFYISRIQSM